jgi:hypothetical protein
MSATRKPDDVPQFFRLNIEVFELLKLVSAPILEVSRGDPLKT